jgi:hypothetical protein
MRILQIDSYIHDKNDIGFRLMCESVGAELVKTNDPEFFIQEWDLVFIPSEFIPPFHFPNAKYIMYGPHNFIFVEGIWKRGDFSFPSNCFYNLLSDWVIQVQEEMGGLSMVSKAVPFGVDIESFNVQKKESDIDCFVYLKNRKAEELEQIAYFLSEKGILFEVIVYGKYTEATYKDILSRAKFGIWIDGAESQGFALEEALSCNVPLVVWDCPSLYDVYGSDMEKYRGKAELKSTACSYWSTECGLVSFNFDEVCQNILEMKENYSLYTPRNFVERELSPFVCMRKLFETCKSL